MNFIILIALTILTAPIYRLALADDEIAESTHVEDAIEAIKKDNPAQDERIKKFTTSLKTKTMVNFAVKNKIRVGRRNSAGQCNLYVVNAVRAAGYPAWTGTSAYYAAQVKEVAVDDLGYVNLLFDYPEMTPQSAPFGSLLVYSSQNTSCNIPDTTQKKLAAVGCGHIEIKTETQFVSDYIDDVPVNHGDNRYKLIAVLIYN